VPCTAGDGITFDFDVESGALTYQAFGTRFARVGDLGPE
jgi:hypothetical protein